MKTGWLVLRNLQPMEADPRIKIFFTSELMNWHNNTNQRSLPWKNEKDPYKIWLSEIILQQTRAEQGLPYYEKFTSKYPSVAHLAAANDDEVFKLWQGLGYYNRCKNLLATARLIASELNGVFPTTYDAIVQLKGIGPYTAAAIASFAFGLPNAVVDGNVYRVLSRFFAIETPTDSTAGKSLFAHLATDLLFKDDSAGYNQAIMDFGATVCKPKNPECANCPLSMKCGALRHGLEHLLPIKEKKVSVLTRYFHYLIIRNNDQFWIQKREKSDIWQNLFEFYLIESDRALDIASISSCADFSKLNTTEKLIYKGEMSQKLTHRLIVSRFFEVQIANKPATLDGGIWINENELHHYSFPKTLVNWFEKNKIKKPETPFY